VPLRGDLQRFEDTLVSVLENQPERSEVVVVTNQPYDDPYDLRREVAFVDAPTSASLLECFAVGLTASRAPIVHLIDAGIEATAGWADPALARFHDRDVATVAPLIADRFQRQTILSAGLRYTRAGAITTIAAGKRTDAFRFDDRVLTAAELGATFYRREALAEVESIADFGCDRAAAVELALALQNAGYHSVSEPGCLVLANRKHFARRGGWRAGVASEQLYRRAAASQDIQQSRLAHAALVATEAIQIPLRPWLLGQLAGRFGAAVGVGSPKGIAIGAQAAAHLTTSSRRTPPFAPPKSRAA
jgi:hypothetical protein